MGTPLGPKYIPYTYMDTLGTLHKTTTWNPGGPGWVYAKTTVVCGLGFRVRVYNTHP